MNGDAEETYLVLGFDKICEFKKLNRNQWEKPNDWIRWIIPIFLKCIRYSVSFSQVSIYSYIFAVFNLVVILSISSWRIVSTLWIRKKNWIQLVF